MATSALPAEILRSIRYRDDNNLPMPPALKLAAFKAIGSLAPINAEYHDMITEALLTFFEGKGAVTAPKNLMRRAATNAFNGAFEMGWAKGGREFPLSADAGEWLYSRLNSEYGNIDTLFVQAKDLRKAGGAYFSWVNARADSYTATLQAIYNAGQMYAAGDKALTWRLGKTEKHCDTCLSLDGTSRPASWYIANDYIPRKPGAAMDCGGWNCDCGLFNKAGDRVTV